MPVSPNLQTIIDDLKEGYGAEDIAVRRGLKHSFVQVLIQGLRDIEMLEKIYMETRYEAQLAKRRQR